MRHRRSDWWSELVIIEVDPHDSNRVEGNVIASISQNSRYSKSVSQWN